MTIVVRKVVMPTLRQNPSNGTPHFMLGRVHATNKVSTALATYAPQPIVFVTR